jgi:[ribosomal protein S5]-alanine N-acetyltransferase
MTSVALESVTQSDAVELIRANIESRSHHEPWIQPFTDAGGFEDWFGGLFTGADVGLVARDLQSGGIVGVVNLSQIFRKGFQNAYLDYFGMVSFARRGLMTEAVRLTALHAFDEIGLHRLEANIQLTNLPSIVQRIGFRNDGLSPRYLRINGIWRGHEQ